jgi:hypothetical protein
MSTQELVESGTRWGGSERASCARPIRAYRFDRSSLPSTHLRRIPEDALVEIDSDGCAYFAIGGERLLFAGDLTWLLRTLDLPVSSLLVDDAALSRDALAAAR